MRKPLFIVLSWFPYSGMAVFPFIVIKHPDLKLNETLVRHERIHFAQQKELLFIGFFLLYLLHYIWNILRYRNHAQAYREIVFEREAYQNDNQPNYLQKRKWLAWLQYLKKSPNHSN